MKTTRKALSLLLALCVFLSSVSMTVFGAGAKTIRTPEDLLSLGGQELAGVIALANDIDMAGYSAEPIKKLVGTFDGKGHEIKNLTLTGSEGERYGNAVYTALIGELEGSIVNLSLTDADISTEAQSNTLGTLVGTVRTGVNLIENCTVTGSVTSTTSAKYPTGDYISGLVGYVFGMSDAPTELTVKNCAVSVNVSGSKNDFVSSAVSYVGAGTVNIENCAFLGDVTADSSAGYAGGIVGQTTSSAKVIVKNSYFAGKSSGSKAFSLAFLSSTGKYAGNLTYGDNCLYLKNGRQLPNPDALSGTAVTGLPVSSDEEALKTPLEGFEIRVGEFGGFPVPKRTSVTPPAPPSAEFSCTVSFTLPADDDGCVITVKKDDETVSPEDDGTYRLTSEGKYGIFVTESEYYEDYSDEFTLYSSDNNGEKNIKIRLAYKAVSLDGEGTAESPYLIGTARELLGFATVLNSSINSPYRTAHFKLKGDIDLNFLSFEPIGKNSVYAFRGVFDGDGHEIKALSVADTESMYVGLFGCLTDGEIKNLRVSGEVFSPEQSAYVGGIAGAVTGNSRIENCVNYCSVSASRKSSVGGICGYYRKSDDIGYEWTDNAVIFSSCVNAGDILISGDDSDVFSEGLAGGILGYSKNCAQFENCLNIGSVHGANLAAGICGSAGSRQGENCAPYIKSCVNTGKITSAVGAYPIYAKENLGESAVFSCFANGGENAFVTVSDNLLSADVLSALGSAWTAGTYIPYPASVGEVSGRTALLSAEAEKYVSAVFIGNDKNIGDGFSLLADGKIPDEGVRAFTVTDSKYISALPSAGFTLSAENDGAGARTERLTLVLQKDGTRVRKTITVLLSAKDSAYDELADKLAGIYASQSVVDEWAVFDMAAYGRLSGKTAKVRDDALQNYINTAITDISSGSALAIDLARAEVILSSIGTDTTKLYPVNSKTPINNPANLRKSDFGSYYTTAIWVLFADEWGSVNLTSAQVKKLVGIIGDSLGGNGLLQYKYGEYTFDDADSTAWALGALARFVSDSRDKYGVLKDAKALSERMTDALSKAQLENGSYGNVNTDASVITGLIAAGIDPKHDARFVKNGASLKDALMLYVNANRTGFVSSYSSDASATDRATEQGFRALVALKAFEENGGRAYNIYAPASVSSIPRRNVAFATGTGEVKTPDVPETEKKINASLTVTYNKKEWIPTASAALNEGSYVYNLIKNVFESVGAEADGLSRGYIKSVTYKGETHTQFDEGKNSGWLFYVNGNLPNVGISDYKLSDGDRVELVYTKDYTTAPGAGGAVGSPDTKNDEKETDDPEKTEQRVYSDVSENDWFFSAVSFMTEKNFMNGVSENEFAPHAGTTRAMVWTVLARMSGIGTSGANTWYEKGRAWALENNISDGKNPDERITREQLAAMLYRYAGFKGLDVSATCDISSFDDAKSISAYADGAMRWAHAMKIVNGKSEKLLDPSGFATRAEIAAMLMRFTENCK